MQIRIKQLVVRLRREGACLVMSLPRRVREELALKSGDLVAVHTYKGNVVARKIDLTPVTRRMENDGPKRREQ